MHGTLHRFLLIFLFTTLYSVYSQCRMYIGVYSRFALHCSTVCLGGTVHSSIGTNAMSSSQSNAHSTIRWKAHRLPHPTDDLITPWPTLKVWSWLPTATNIPGGWYARRFLMHFASSGPACTGQQSRIRKRSYFGTCRGQLHSSPDTCRRW